MFVMFTPYSYLFFSLYLSILLFITTVSNFFVYWLIIELIALLLMGISYTIFTSGVSQLIVYFLVQSLSSFFILVSYLINSSVLLSFSLFLNLGLFPFMTWYLNVLGRFPNFVFWLAGTFHNIPPVLMLTQFSLVLPHYLFWLVLTINSMIAGFLILSTLDFRFLLISSSIANNSWFLLSSQSSLHLFYAFVFTYSLFLALLLSTSNQNLKPSYTTNGHYLFRWWLYIFTLSGLPPFPIFFLNMAVVLSIISTMPYTYMLYLFLLFNVFVIASYVNYSMQFLVNRYSNMLYVR